jgi:serine protease AprX
VSASAASARAGVVPQLAFPLAAGNNAARKDLGSLFTVENAIGGCYTWDRRDAAGQPVTGAAVGVALLDFGVAPVHGTGQGSPEAAQGGDDPTDADGNVISGEGDIQGIAWNAPDWWAASSSLTAWSGGQWMGTTWTRDGWVSDPSGLSSARWSTGLG